VTHRGVDPSSWRDEILSSSVDMFIQARDVKQAADPTHGPGSASPMR